MSVFLKDYNFKQYQYHIKLTVILNVTKHPIRIELLICPFLPNLFFSQTLPHHQLRAQHPFRCSGL